MFFVFLTDKRCSRGAVLVHVVSSIRRHVPSSSFATVFDSIALFCASCHRENGVCEKQNIFRFNGHYLAAHRFVVYNPPRKSSLLKVGTVVGDDTLPLLFVGDRLTEKTSCARTVSEFDGDGRRAGQCRQRTAARSRVRRELRLDSKGTRFLCCRSLTTVVFS